MDSGPPRRKTARATSRPISAIVLVVLAAVVTTVFAFFSHFRASNNPATPPHLGPSRGKIAAAKKRVTGAHFYHENRLLSSEGGSSSQAPSCLGASKRNPPTCIPMPHERDFRIAIAALPPEAYSKSAVPSENVADDPGDPVWLDAAYAAAWKFATGKFEEWVDIDLQRSPPTLAQIRDSLMTIDVPDDVVRPPPDRSAPILRTQRLEQAVALSRARFSLISSMQPAFTFTSQSQRDLERIVVAHMLVSPFTHFMDMRVTTAAELRSFDFVFIPFPLIAMRDSPKMATRFQDIMARYVPTLAVDPERHVFIFGRLFRDTMLLPSFKKSFRPLIQVAPFNRARFMTTQPYEGEGKIPRDRSIITLPYPSVARASLTGWEEPNEIDTRHLPWSLVTPHSIGKPQAACEVLCADDAAFTARSAQTCRAVDAMEAIHATRPILIAFLGEPRDKQPERVAALKQLRACDQCAVFDLSSEGLSGGGDDGGVAYGMTWVYSMSVFCVHPHGDAPPRKAFFDGLSLGCIPVVLAKDDPDLKARVQAPLLPFEPLLPWSEFVVTLTRAEWFKGLVPALKAIPPARIRAMQQALSRHGHLTQWSWPPGMLEDTRRRRPDDPPKKKGPAVAAEGVDSPPPQDRLPPGPPPALESRPVQPARECALDAADMLMVYLASEAKASRPLRGGGRGAALEESA